MLKPVCQSIEDGQLISVN